MADQLHYHTHLSKALTQGAEYAIVPGDPDRVPLLAKALDKNATELADHRGIKSYLAHFQSQPILVCSTGMGGPSTAVVIEELAAIGIRYFLRVGTCGSIQPHIHATDLVITQGAVRIDGTSEDYAPIEYPAVPSLELTQSILNAAKTCDIPHHLGITLSTKSFQPSQERYDGMSHVLTKFQGSLEEWERLNVANIEMEAATLLTMCKTAGLEAAAVCGVVAARHKEDNPTKDANIVLAERFEKIVIETLKQEFIRREISSQ